MRATSLPNAWDAPELRPLWELAADPARLGAWRKLVLRRRSRGDTEGWERLSLSPVALRRGAAVKCVAAAGARQRTEIVAAAAWRAHLGALGAEGFDEVHLVSATVEWHGRRTKKGRWLVSRGTPEAAGATTSAGGLRPHDRTHAYPLPPDHPDVVRLFVATGVFGAGGHVRGAQAAKFRQVQHYIDLLRPLPVWEAARQAARPLRVVDAACGKAYLSLALGVYARLQGLSVELVGVDSNPALVATVRRIAAELGDDRARFVTGPVRDLLGSGVVEPGSVDLLVSLHACNTATDESLAAGVHLGADAIVLAPCCHHELAAQLGRGADGAGDRTAPGRLRPVLRHGVLRGRFADLLTDGLRATALEAAGYHAEVIEFVEAEHTAKNVMIRAVRRPPGAATEAIARSAGRAYEELVEAWEVRPSTRELLGSAWPDPAPGPPPPA